MADKEQELCFENLACYQQGLKLYDAAYRLAASLPAQERYNLADQLRRAALSVLLNIAEGYGRYHYLDKLRFFYIARGSLCETLSAFICARQVGYIDNDQLAWVRDTELEAEKSLNGYVSYIRKQQKGKTEFGHSYVREEIPIYHVIPVPENTEEFGPDLSDQEIPPVASR